jgi:stage V sporulation protein D (sporulation-specific penicillin-binding protein)
MTPYVVQAMTDDSGSVIWERQPEVRRRVISEEVSATLSQILEEGVSGNGGAKNAYVAGYKIAAKTGTSEKIGDVDDAHIGSCVAFAPADDAQLAVIIILDEPTGENYYGSIIAAPYVARFLETVLPYLGVEPAYSEAELEKMAMTVPGYVGWSVNLATQYAEKAGLEVTVIGSGTVVGSQIPEGGAVVEKDSARLILYTRGERAESTVKVPDVVGMTAAAANRLIVSSGLNIRILGAKQYLSGQTAVAVSQSVAAGTMVPAGTVVEVSFYYLDDRDD